MLDQIVCALFCAKVQITTYEKPIIEPIREERTISIEYAKPSSDLQNNIQRGFVSSYSATYGGCLGCTKHYDENGQLYYITASGDRLDDNKFTIASNQFRLGQRVTLINLSNGKSIGAIVNDTGGFDTPQYNNRIADLSVATMNALEAKTDIDLIEIQELE